jgi:hypothetical protein
MHRSTVLYLTCAAALCARAAKAQAVFEAGTFKTTVEAYVNATGATTNGDTGNLDPATDDVRVDAALRVLIRAGRTAGPDWGVRLVAEASPERDVELAEASVLVFGSHGRLEFGERQGLPDVLTGYAPNNFTFTSADFGPASGPSLDPGGGLQVSFLGADVASQVAALSSLGFTATLAEDRSTKALYVSPKTAGYLYGLSYSPDADDGRFGALTQAGLTKEWYWAQNVLRVGGSYSHANGEHRQDTLDSINAGSTVVIDDALSLGIAMTWNGKSGLPVDATDRTDTWGITASANYNVGRWTFGGYVQHAVGAGDAHVPGADTLDAYEVGASWRSTTRLRLYAAWYAWRLDDEQTTVRNGDMVLLGVRAAL